MENNARFTLQKVQVVPVCREDSGLANASGTETCLTHTVDGKTAENRNPSTMA